MLRGYHGDFPERLWEVLAAAHEIGGLSVQADFTRSHSLEVGLGASLGWLTTISPDGDTYGGRWRLSVAGLQALYSKEQLDGSQSSGA